MTKKKNSRSHPKLIAFLIILIAFGIFYGWGAVYYQKNLQVNRIIAAMNDPKVGMAKYVTASDPDVTLTDAKLRPLQNYFKENPKAAKELENNLRHDKNNQQIKLVNSGSHFLLFPKYTLKVQVYRPQVQTNHPNSVLTVNDHNLGKMDGANQNFYQDLGQVFPGRYHLLVKTKVAGRKLTADAIVNIWSSKTINMTIKTGTFQIRSVSKGIVYINDKKVKVLDQNGQASFKNYPLAKDTELYIKASYQGKTIKSEKVKDLSSSITSEFSNSEDDTSDYGSVTNYAGNQNRDVYQDVEGDYVVNPLWTGLITRNEAGKLLYRNYLKPNADNFVDKKKNKSYKNLLKNKLNKKKVKLAVKVIKILPAGDNYSDVSYQLVCKFKQNGKKTKKVINYENGIFHRSGEKQLIKHLGKKVK